MELYITDEGDILFRKYSRTRAIKQGPRIGIAVLSSRFPSVPFMALDKDAMPADNGRRVSDAETYLETAYK